MNDLAKNYASLPIEDIQLLALDAKSLTDEAREALRLEMERRQLPNLSTDWTTQPTLIKTDWASDWKQTGIRSQYLLIGLAALTIFASLVGAVLNLQDHDYANAAAFPIPIILIGLRLVIFPFRIACAARRRGGSFNRWLAGSLFGGYIFAGLAYLVWQNGKEVLPEYHQAIPIS